MERYGLPAKQALKWGVEDWRALLRRVTEMKGQLLKSKQSIPLTMPVSALCGLFYRGVRCEGCPVAEFTGEGLCKGTPFVEVYKEVGNYFANKIPIDAGFIEAVREEVNFLQSLEKSMDTDKETV